MTHKKKVFSGRTTENNFFSSKEQFTKKMQLESLRSGGGVLKLSGQTIKKNFLCVSSLSSVSKAV